MITARIEDYLEEIFLLESSGREITVTDLAERLGITKGTVTATVQKLVEAGFLNHERYGAVHLTDAGRRKGLTVYRRHDGLRAFFHELLGLDRDRSSEIACGMEHYLDAVTEKRLYAMLEFFRRARAEKHPWTEELVASTENPIFLPVPLTLTEAGDRGTVARLTADAPLRQRLHDRGFVSGATVSCLGMNQGSIVVTVGKNEAALPVNEAAAVWMNCDA